MKKLYTIIIAFLLTIVTLYAQQNTSATGGNASSSSGSVSYTVGQIDYISSHDNTGSITQGLQQPYEILIVSGIERKDIQLSASLYPNPTSDFVLLTLEEIALEKMSCGLYDVEGRLISSIKLSCLQTTIPLSNLPNASYLLKISNDTAILKIFKIIKNQ
ncbi:MAG TPA: T9SS type A sorting domain-containing protein [Cytophagaceae bacterium]|jgi:hypothetical protein|nr:T9SS type A sorting domain-containing protein [Cytophagaceae bacterium]